MARLNFQFRRNVRQRWPEWVLAYAMLFIGISFLRNDHVFDHVVYVNMSRVMTSTSWAIILIAVAVPRLVSLFFNGMWPPSYSCRMITAILSVPIWFQFFILYWSYDAFVPGMVFSQVPILIEISNIIFSTQERAGTTQSNGR